MRNLTITPDDYGCDMDVDKCAECDLYWECLLNEDERY